MDSKKIDEPIPFVIDVSSVDKRSYIGYIEEEYEKSFLKPKNN